MTLWVRRRSALVRWAYLFAGGAKHTSDRTSLCALFWLSVFSAAMCLGIAFAAVTVFMLMGLMAVGLPLWQVIVCWISVPTIAYVIRAWYRSSLVFGDELPALHALVQGAKAVKTRICPIVEIRE